MQNSCSETSFIFALQKADTLKHETTISHQKGMAKTMAIVAKILA